MNDLIYTQAVNLALTESATADTRIIFMGEGVHDDNAVYGTMSGLLDKFGPDRVIEMPTAENAMVGVAVGLAISGYRPVISFHRVEFALLALEQIINNAAKMNYISNGKHNVPLITRLIVGRGWGQGAVHAQSLEALFAMIPGLRVVMPSTPNDVYWALKKAFTINDPTIIIEHRWCHGLTGTIDDADRPRAVCGDHLTVVATSYMAVEARRAAMSLRKIGIDLDVFDLNVIRPLGLSGVFESVRRTGRLLTVDTGHKLHGVGAEVVAQVTDKCFHELKLAPRRLGLPDHPVPSSRYLLDGYYPDAAMIFEIAAEMLGQPVIEGSDAHKLQQELVPPTIDQPSSTFAGPF